MPGSTVPGPEADPVLEQKYRENLSTAVSGGSKALRHAYDVSNLVVSTGIRIRSCHGKC